MMNQKDRCQKGEESICSAFGLVAYSTVRKNEYSTVPEAPKIKFEITGKRKIRTGIKFEITQNWYPNPNRLATFS